MYSKNFWLLSLSVFLFMTSFNLIIPELNEFITVLNGEQYKGLVIALFTLTAGISRPFSGKMADTIGRKSTLYIGTIVCIVVTLLYPLSTGVLFFLILRLLHGFSTGFLPTGATAMIADILPIDKRGKGMGIFSTGIALGTGVGQFFASPITKALHFNGLFICSSAIAILALVIIRNVKETLVKPQPFSLALFKVSRSDIIEKNVIPPAIVMFLISACSGLVLVITPDISSYLGITNKGWFYAFYILSTILVRLFLGHLSDKVGRRPILLTGSLLLTIAMLMVAFANNLLIYTLSSFIYGCAFGILTPALFAWMTDLSPTSRKGAGSATIYIALEFGILFGSTLTLFQYDSTVNTVKTSFITGAILALFALLYLTIHIIKSKTTKYF